MFEARSQRLPFRYLELTISLGIVYLITFSPGTFNGEWSVLALDGKITSSQDGYDQIFAQTDLCSIGWVNILGTGRSGTTTILDMLRLVPQLHIRGETKLLKPAEEMYATVTTGTSRTRFDLREVPQGPMLHRRINKTHLLLALQHWFVAVNPLSTDDYSGSDVRFGFKEISFERGHLDLMEKLFPCGKFILSVRRDIGEQSKSAWWSQSFSQNQSIAAIHNKTTQLVDWHKHLGPERSFLVFLEDFSPIVFNEMLRWIGIGGCTYFKVLHSNNKSYASDSNTSGALSGKCYMNT